MHPLDRGVTRGLLAGLLVTAAACGSDPEPHREAGSRTVFPETIRVETLDWTQTAARLDNRPAPYTLVNLWATWCPPCVAELPDFELAARELASRGVDAVTISMDVSLPAGEPVDAAGIRRFLEERDLVLPVWLYDGDLNPLAERLRWDSGALPFTAVLDAEGRVLARHSSGATDRAGFLKLFEEARRQQQ